MSFVQMLFIHPMAATKNFGYLKRVEEMDEVHKEAQWGGSTLAEWHILLSL